MNQKEPSRSESFTGRRPPQAASPAPQSRPAPARAPTAKAPQTAAKSPGGQSFQTQGPAPAKAAKPALTHQQIALRARAIWQAKGCKPGQDKENWMEAEAQLKREMGIS